VRLHAAGIHRHLAIRTMNLAAGPTGNRTGMAVESSRATHLGFQRQRPQSERSDLLPPLAIANICTRRM